MARTRQRFSAEYLHKVVYKKFQLVQDPPKNRSCSFSLADCLMSGFAMFSLKYPSLLQFDQGHAEDEALKYNLKNLYNIKAVPCDTQIRERLDPIEPSKIRKPFKAIFAQLQRGKVLEQYQYLDKSYLLSVDGTGVFSSHEIHCQNCCEKHHRNGSVTYYHQLLGAAIIHPDHKVVIPMAPEPILKQDGNEKNDCERNAAKRLLENLRKEHPFLKIIVVEDGLASNCPHVQTLNLLNFSYILGIKPGDHKSLFTWLEGENCTTHETIDQNKVVHRFRFINKAPLNEVNFECKVNFVEYWEINPKGPMQHFSWITDLTVTKENVFAIMRGGRARWRIENETFNTLKNQGYNFSHNFGHGYQYLHTVFSMLMMLAFLIDQTQAFCCPSFKKAWEKMHSKIRLWERIRNMVTLCQIPGGWTMLLEAIAQGIKPKTLFFDTS